MSHDIENIEQIESYLEGKLTGSQLDDFNLKMEADEYFRSKVDTQKLLVEGVKKAAMKQELNLIHKQMYSNKSNHFFGNKNLLRIITITLISVGAFIGILYLNNVEVNKKEKHNDENVTNVHNNQKDKGTVTSSPKESKVEASKSSMVYTNTNYDHSDSSGFRSHDPTIFYPVDTSSFQDEEQIKDPFAFQELLSNVPSKGVESRFKLNPIKGGTLRVKGGGTITIPPNCFVDAKNNPITTPVDIRVIEYYNVIDFIRQHTQSKTDKDIYQPKGMFYFEFLSNDQKVNVKNGVSIKLNTSIPKNKKKFLVFKGHKNVNSKLIDWTSLQASRPSFKYKKGKWHLSDNDKEIEKFTTITPIYRYRNQKLTRFVCLPHSDIKYSQLFKGKYSIAVQNSISKFSQEKFRNTYVSTFQFLERIAVALEFDMSESILKEYAQNIHLPLHKVDSLVIQKIKNHYFPNCNIFVDKKEEHWKLLNYFYYLKAQQYTTPIIYKGRIPLDKEEITQNQETNTSSIVDELNGIKFALKENNNIKTHEWHVHEQYYKRYKSISYYVHSISKLKVDKFDFKVDMRKAQYIEHQEAFLKLNSCERACFNKNINSIDRKKWPLIPYHINEEASFSFDVNKSGWYSVGHQYPQDKRKYDVLVTVKEIHRYDIVQSYLLFSGNQVIIQPENVTGITTFKNIPRNEDVLYIGLAKKGDQLYFYQFRLKVNKPNNRINVELQPVTEFKFKEFLSRAMIAQDLRGIEYQKYPTKH